MTISRGRPSDRHERLMAMRTKRRRLDDADVEAAIEDTLSLGGERPRRRTHHRRPTKEPRSWTPTGHLAPAA